MNILEQLNSGAFHNKARVTSSDCVDTVGNIHRSPERARFADWKRNAKKTHGIDTRAWPADVRAELDKRHVK